MIAVVCIAFALAVALGGLYVMMEVRDGKAAIVCAIICGVCIAGGIWFFTHLAPEPQLINIAVPETGTVEVRVLDGEIVMRPPVN